MNGMDVEFYNLTVFQLPTGYQTFLGTKWSVNEVTWYQRSVVKVLCVFYFWLFAKYVIQISRLFDWFSYWHCVLGHRYFNSIIIIFWLALWYLVQYRVWCVYNVMFIYAKVCFQSALCFFLFCGCLINMSNK